MAYCTHVWSRRGIRERQQEKLGQDENMFIDPRSPTKRKKNKRSHQDTATSAKKHRPGETPSSSQRNKNNGWIKITLALADFRGN